MHPGLAGLLGGCKFGSEVEALGLHDSGVRLFICLWGGCQSEADRVIGGHSPHPLWGVSSVILMDGWFGNFQGHRQLKCHVQPR